MPKSCKPPRWTASNGIPISVTARVFYFNDETWKKPGVEYPKTWDELMAAGKTFESKLGKQYYPVVLEHQDTLALLNSYMIQKYNQPAIDEKPRNSPTAKSSGSNSSRCIKKAYRQPRHAGHQVLCLVR